MKLNGIEIVSHPLVREFTPKLEMRPCGCSQRCLDDMNAWLLKRFGGEREMLVIGGRVFVHPNVYRHLTAALPK